MNDLFSWIFVIALCAITIYFFKGCKSEQKTEGVLVMKEDTVVKSLIGFWFIIMLLVLGFWIGVGYIILHFVLKFW